MTGPHPSPKKTLFKPPWVLQDRYALQSYQRAANAWQRGAFDLEVAPVRVKNPRATPKLGVGKNWMNVLDPKKAHITGGGGDVFMGWFYI